LQASSLIHADSLQLDALENGCGLVRWDRATIVKHSGPDALDLLHRLTTNELLAIGEGRAQRTVLTTDRGRVVDVFLVAHVSENQLLLISDSEDSERTISAIDYYTIIEDAELADLSGSHRRFSLIGPKASTVVKSALGVDVGPGQLAVVESAGASITVISDPSRGVDWIDIVHEYDAGDAGDSIEALFESSGFVAVSPATFDLYRIGRGIPAPDREYGEHANPIESGLLDLIEFDKGCYVGQEVIARLDAYDKVKRNLKVLESDEPLEAGAALHLPGGSKPAGTITSTSPLTTEDGVFLSLGLVRKAFLGSGTVLESDRITLRVRQGVFSLSTGEM